MVNAFTIAISLDSPQLLRVGVTPEEAWFLASGDPLVFAAITLYASTIKEALVLTSIYQLGDAIMAAVLKNYQKTTVGTGEEALIPAVTLLEGERIDSLVAYNPTGSAITAEVIIKSGATEFSHFTESVAAGASTFMIGGFDKVNLAQNTLVNVKSSTLGMLFYASNVIGVSV